MPCRALEAFRLMVPAREPTDEEIYVLMPCRALEAFRRIHPPGSGCDGHGVLMPCRALEAFRRKLTIWFALPPEVSVLMPCRALEAFRRR